MSEQKSSNNLTIILIISNNFQGTDFRVEAAFANQNDAKAKMRQYIKPSRVVGLMEFDIQ